MTLGHFGPRALCPRIFWSLVILAWDISVPGHFSPGSFQSQVYWFLGHFSPGSCKEHFGPRAFAKDISIPGHFGVQFISILGHLAKVVMGQCHFSPWSLQPCDFGPWVISAHVHFGNFICRSFLPGFISILVISAPGHFCSVSFWSRVILAPRSFQPWVILATGHFDPLSFGWVISVQGHFSHGNFGPWSFCSLVISVPGTFWCCDILVPGHIDPGSFWSPWNISVPGHFGPRAFCTKSFLFQGILPCDILGLGHFSPWSFQLRVISVLGHFSPGSFQPLEISARVV